MIITIGRKPFKGTVCDNMESNSCGGINIKISRLSTQAESFIDKGRESKGSAMDWSKKKANGDSKERKETIYDGSKGRFPANFFITENTGAILDQQSGVSISTGGRIGNAQGVYSNQGRTGWGTGHEKGESGFGDVGGASRYFKKI